MKVLDFLRPDMVVDDLQSTTKAGALVELARHMSLGLPTVDPAELRRVLEEREQVASTGIGEGIAIPHGRLDSVGQLVGCLGRSRPGVEFDSVDGKPAHLLFMLVAPSASTGVHLKALARLSRLFRDPDFRRRLLEAPGADAMFAAIQEEDAKS